MRDEHLSLDGFTQMVDSLLVSTEQQPDFETEGAVMVYKKITIWENAISPANCDVDSEENMEAQKNGVRLELLLPTTITTETMKVNTDSNLVDYITDAHCGDCHCCLPEDIVRAIGATTLVQHCKGKLQYPVSKWYETIYALIDWIKGESMEKLSVNKPLDECYAILRCLRHLVEDETLKDVDKSDIVDAVEKGVLLTAYGRNTIQKIILRELIEKAEERIQDHENRTKGNKGYIPRKKTFTQWTNSPIYVADYCSTGEE